jgi:uncharacterized protein (DUF2141 family)
LTLVKLLPLLLLATCAKRDVDQGIVQSGISCAGTTDIHVIVRGLRSTDGQLLVALYGSSNGFPGDPTKALRRLEHSISGEIAEVTFDSVAAGRYAVSVVHDENADEQMQRDWLGRPKEGWGVSNDARGRFGPPSFDDAQFEASGKAVTVEINLEYR